MHPRIKFSRLGLVAAIALAAAFVRPHPSAAQTKNTGSTSPPSKEETDRRIQELEESLKQLKKDTRGLEAREEDRSKIKPVAGWQDGFFVQSPDNNFKLRIGGYAQADGRYFIEEDRSLSQFLFRRVRPDIRGTLFKIYDFRFVPDFAGSTARLFDAYLDAKFLPEFQVRGGKFKPPVGLERLQSAVALTFIERALPTNLVPTRDLGFQLQGDLWRVLNYQAGIFNGAADLANNDGDIDDSKEFAGRLFAHPLRDSPWEFARGLGIGISGTYGHTKGSTSNTYLPQYRTPGQAVFFSYRTDSPATTGGTTIADGTRYRYSPQGYYYFGPFGLLGEYVYSAQGLRRGAVQNDIANDSWQLAASWVVTGEENSFKGVVPAENFDPFNKKFGALLLGVRYAELSIDDDAFTQGFSNPSSSARSARELTVGFNWILNRSILLAFNYEKSKYKGGAASGDREDEDVVMSRLQLSL